MIDRIQRDARRGATHGVRRHAREVAFSASVVALVVYLIAAAVTDFAVLGHLHDSIDSRLVTRLDEIVKTLPSSGVPVSSQISSPSQQKEHVRAAQFGTDFDDAPTFAWWIPTGSRTVVPLVDGAPALPADRIEMTGFSDMSLAGRPFRLSSTTLSHGRLVVATSVAQYVELRTILLVAEGSLLPIMLLTFFVVATLIGRRAATPIERARQQQLDFTADASHELRTPLSVIEAEVGLALSTQRDASAYRESLERVAQESKRLRGIVDDLLWLARVDAIPGAPPREPVDLAALVQSCARRFQPIASSREVTLHFGVSDSESTIVNAPAEWLDRLVSVLVDNACRYCGAGGRIEVSASFFEGRPTLTVEDSGPGIAEKDRNDVFQRFHRANAEPGGAGLGLSIADTIVRATGGRWELGEAVGGGARMQISWPRHRSDTHRSSSETQQPHGPAGEAPDEDAAEASGDAPIDRDLTSRATGLSARHGK